MTTNLPSKSNLTKHQWSVQSKIRAYSGSVDSFHIVTGDESPYYELNHLQFKGGQTPRFASAFFLDIRFRELVWKP